MAFKDVLVSRPVSVVTPIVSSLAGALRRYFCSVLPDSYLRDYFVDTELPLARKMSRRRFRPLSRSQVEMRHLPLLSVRVEVTADSSEFSSGVTFWTSTAYLRDPTQLSRLIADDANLIYVGYETERVVVRFQVSVTVETDLKAYELAMYLRRTLPVNQKFYLNDIDIATEIPMHVVRTVWSSLGYGDSADPADLEEFRHYMKSVSAGNIEQLVNSANGRAAFAFSYRANPLMSITGVPTISVNRDGNVVKNAQVDLPFEADISVPVAYALRAEESLGGPLHGHPLFVDEAGGTPYFSAARTMRPPETLNGMLSLAYITSVVTGDPDPMHPTAPDVTDLSASVGPMLRDYIEQLLLQGDEEKVDARLWLDGEETDPATWEFDPSTWMLEIRKPTLMARQRYHFGVYADLSDIKALSPEKRRPQAASPMLRTR